MTTTMIIIVLCAVIAILVFLLLQKKANDLQQLINYKNQVSNAKAQLLGAKEEYNSIITQTAQMNKKYNTLILKYQEAVIHNEEEIQYLREHRQEDLDKEFEGRRKEAEAKLQLSLNNKKQDYQILEQNIATAIQQANEQKFKIQQNVQFEQEKFQNILAPLRQYQREQQERLFYTIQVPEEYRDDINFLLTSVAQKVRHPDIISKLVWSEYIKPYLDDTFKRIEIKAEPGIYKLTNISTNKPYIGKSTDVKKRITDHFKGSVGIRNIADQTVHHAILQDGIWNWTIEVITYCDKDKLSELEKYYIDFFKTQEYGYNRKQGG